MVQGEGPMHGETGGGALGSSHSPTSTEIFKELINGMVIFCTVADFQYLLFLVHVLSFENFPLSPNFI